MWIIWDHDALANNAKLSREYARRNWIEQCLQEQGISLQPIALREAHQHHAGDLGGDGHGAGAGQHNRKLKQWLGRGEIRVHYSLLLPTPLTRGGAGGGVDHALASPVA